MKKRNIVTLAVSLTAGVIFTLFLALLIFGRTVFACSSDNVLGLESVSIRGHKITLEFDQNESMRKDSEPYGAVSYKVDFKNKTIVADLVSVEGEGMYTITTSTYTQGYNPITRTWSEPEVEQSTGYLWT